MRKTKATSFTPLDSISAIPFYRQIYDRVRWAIAEGVLKPGDRVPSVRALTKDLGLARGTIDTAYALLAAEGYIVACGQAGTIVTPDLDPDLARRRPTPLPESTVSAFRFRPDTIIPFQMGLPALDAFPRKIWARLSARSARAMQPADMVHPSVFGSPELRVQIASYLQMSRGISCTPSQVFVTSGYRHTIELIAHVVLKGGDRVWLENPGYPPTRHLLRHMNITPVAIPVDQDGMVVSEGLARAPDARAAVVTPAHQSPLCVSLSLPRRQALLDWARSNKSWVIEDDYDGEYRYISRPLPALKSLDRDGRVLYSGTFSKVLLPSLRLAYLVVPESLVEPFERVSETFTGGSPHLTQSIVTAFITEGHFTRHIQRMRRLYTERRDWTASAFEAILGKAMRVTSPPGGMHLIVRPEGLLSDRDLVARLGLAGLYSEALSDWMIEGKTPAGLLLNFTNVESRKAADALAERIRKVL